MALDPYANGYTPTSTAPIESFSTPPKGSLEFDLDQVVKKQNQKKYYSESMSSYKDLPSFKTPDSLEVSSPAVAQLSSSKVEEKKGFFSNAWDKICSFFTGTSTSNTSSNPVVDGGEGSMIGSTPRLAASSAEWKKTQATMERLNQLLEDANKIIDDLQGVTKEGVQIDEVAERLKTNWEYFFIKLLKKQNTLTEKMQLGNSEEITTIYQAMKTMQEEIRAAALNCTDLKSKMYWYDLAGTGASAISGVAGLLMGGLQIAALAGYVTANPVGVAFGMAATAGGIACAGIKGATSLASTYLNRQKIAEEGKIMIGKHRRQDAATRVKDRVQDDKGAQDLMKATFAAMAAQQRSKVEETRMFQQLSR